VAARTALRRGVRIEPEMIRVASGEYEITVVVEKPRATQEAVQEVSFALLPAASTRSAGAPRGRST
jgi:hypothetical protein